MRRDVWDGRQCVWLAGDAPLWKVSAGLRRLLGLPLRCRGVNKLQEHRCGGRACASPVHTPYPPQRTAHTPEHIACPPQRTLHVPVRALHAPMCALD